MNTRQKIRSVTLAFSFALFGLSGSALGDARDAYKFEMIIFERPGVVENEFWPADPGAPSRSDAVANLEGGGALPATSRNLGPLAYTLKRKGMIVHKHVVWRQVPGRRDGPSWRWLDGGRLNGLVRITRGRFLHLDTDLLLRDVNAPAPYRIKLNRRMRSDELHYVDHPKLGILIQATRLRAAAPAPEAGDAASGEPKPATPAATAQPG